MAEPKILTIPSANNDAEQLVPSSASGDGKWYGQSEKHFDSSLWSYICTCHATQESLLCVYLF